VQFNQSPLHSAAFGGHLPWVQLLVEKGATVDAKSKVKQACLWLPTYACGCKPIRHPGSNDNSVFVLVGLAVSLNAKIDLLQRGPSCMA
jgi:hypothetical protein